MQGGSLESLRLKITFPSAPLFYLPLPLSPPPLSLSLSSSSLSCGPPCLLYARISQCVAGDMCQPTVLEERPCEAICIAPLSSLSLSLSRGPVSN
jgi:hypothetical protein